MFTNATNVTVQSSTFVHNHQVPKGGFERLQEYVIHGAFHDSGERFDPPKCHPNTRVAIINWITNWISGLDEDTREAVVMWLYGAAGAGKSAIAQTIAEILDGQHFILTSFFFSRNDPQRGTAKLLVPTLAYQLAVKLPQAYRDRVSLTFEHDPLIVTRALEAQFKALIREPILHLIQMGFSSNNPFVVIIDGLDECQDSKVQAKIVDLAFSLLRSRDIPVKILIASRPEIDISSSFGSKPSSMLARVALDDDYQSKDDIRLFLADKFNEIKIQHCLRAYIPERWPPNNSLDALVQKSSGQFIYAATAMKYVASPRHRPTDRLQIVLGIRPAKVGDSPFAELDALYRHIIMGCEDVELVLKIIGFVILRPESEPATSVDFIEAIFSLNPGDVHLLMQNLSSLISFDETWRFVAHTSYIRILHASLKDYLVDQSRSKDLYLNPPKMHAHYAELCFTHMTPDEYRNGTVFRFFFYHCPLAEPNPKLLGNVLNLPLSRCFALRTGKDQNFWIIGYYFNYLASLKSNWANSKICRFYADQIVALEQLFKSQLDPFLPHPYVPFLLIAMLGGESDQSFIYETYPDSLFNMEQYLGSARRTTELGMTLRFLIRLCPVLGESLRGSLQSWITSRQKLSNISSTYASAALFALRYISTYWPYAVGTIIPGSSRYDQTRKNSPAVLRWYRRSVHRRSKVYYMNSKFHTFLWNAVGRRRFVDIASRHYNRSERLNMGFGHEFHWLMQVLPIFLEKSGHSEELIVYARHARIRRTHHDSDLGWRGSRKFVQTAVKAYLKRVKGGSL